MDRPVTNWSCLPPPLRVEYSPQFPSPQTGPLFHPTADSENMHPNKRCRRSLACPNRTTPEYHNVDMVFRWGGRSSFELLHP